MTIVYFSATGNVAKFIKKLSLDKGSIIPGSSSLELSEPFILITYTSGFGEVPSQVEEFLAKEANGQNLKFVVGSGNKNWGEAYCKGAIDISERYNCPLLMTFELAGNSHDIAKFEKLYQTVGCKYD